MKKMILASALLTLIIGATAFDGTEPSKTSAAPPKDIASRIADAATYQEMLDTLPVPRETPFDGDERKRGQYITSYREGYIWAIGKGWNTACI